MSEFIPNAWTACSDPSKSITPAGRMSRATRKGIRVTVSARTYGSTMTVGMQRAAYESAAKLGPMSVAVATPVAEVATPDERVSEILADAMDREVAAETVPTPAKKWSKTMSEDERAAYREAKRSEATAMLKEAAQALLTSEGWKAWAACRASFRRYSVSNTFLILVQTQGNASMVASYKKWSEMGRQVRKGTKAIRIFAPLMRKPNAEEIARGANPDKEIVTGFRLVPVFDVAMTEGDDLPIPVSEPITGDSHMGLIPNLLGLAESLGYSVDFETMPHGVGGYCDSILKRIAIEADAPPNAQVRVLVHEIAHALGVGYKDYGRKAAEVLVETVTHVVCLGVGLDTSGESIPYVAGWGEDDNLKAVETFAGIVDEVARKIEKAIH